MSHDTNGSSQAPNAQEACMSTKTEASTEAARLAAWVKEAVRAYGLDLVLHGKADRMALDAAIDRLAATARISELEAEVERLRADAERLDAFQSELDGAEGVCDLPIWDAMCEAVGNIGANVRAAIDQARQALKGGA